MYRQRVKNHRITLQKKKLFGLIRKKYLKFKVVVDLLFFRLQMYLASNCTGTYYTVVPARCTWYDLASSIHKRPSNDNSIRGGAWSNISRLSYCKLGLLESLCETSTTAASSNSINNSAYSVVCYPEYSFLCDPIPSFRLLLFDLKNDSIFFCSPILQNQTGKHQSLTK